MSYRDNQEQCAKRWRINTLKDANSVLLTDNKERNLCELFRNEAIAYFNENEIPFWTLQWETDKSRPTGRLLSSQIACVNHLFIARRRQDVATVVLKNIDSAVECAEMLESGYVEFEVIGRDNYLNERQHTRGALSTSVDAVMLAKMVDGSMKLFFIEWKYTESYLENTESTKKYLGASGMRRTATYSPLLQCADSPIKPVDMKGLLTEPYYQLMRQTLLAHEMVKANEYGASDYVHIHVIPAENVELRNVNTAKGKLAGKTLHETWSNVLKNPAKYKLVDPKDLLSTAEKCEGTGEWLEYLSKRYWKGEDEGGLWDRIGNCQFRTDKTCLFVRSVNLCCNSQYCYISGCLKVALPPEPHHPCPFVADEQFAATKFV